MVLWKHPSLIPSCVDKVSMTRGAMVDLLNPKSCWSSKSPETVAEDGPDSFPPLTFTWKTFFDIIQMALGGEERKRQPKMLIKHLILTSMCFRQSQISLGISYKRHQKINGFQSVQLFFIDFFIEKTIYLLNKPQLAGFT